MPEDLLTAIVGAVGAGVGVIAGQLFTASKNYFDTTKAAQEMQADNQRLWQWNRALVDHIYKGLGPPPPEPPEDLFNHDND